MIKINFTEPDTDEWRSWREQCRDEQGHLNEARSSNTPRPIKEPIYKGTKFNIKADVFMNENGPFFGKCAYCEETISRNQFGDIEHYRPKARVRNGDNAIVMIVADGKDIEHPGYYWLAYDWQNLLPSCILCNKQPSEDDPYGKGNRFPVNGEYAVSADTQDREVPLLLNPTVNDPNDHLNMNELGIIEWTTEMGRMSVELLGLNQRGLPDARKEKYESARDAVGALLRAAAIESDGNDIHRLSEKIRRIKNGSDEHAMAGRKGIAAARNNAERLLDELE